MSEFVEPDFVVEEFLETIDSDVLNAITEYDAAKKKYFGLAATIRNDLPAREEFEGALEVSAAEISYSFGEVVLATYESYGLHESKEAVTDLWYYEQEERVNYMGAIVDCSNVDCHENYSKEVIQNMVDDIFTSSLDEDDLLANAKIAYFEMLQSDVQGFVNHIEAIRNGPKSLLSVLIPIEFASRFNTDSMRRKVAKLSGFALGVSIGGAVVSKILGRKEG